MSGYHQKIDTADMHITSGEGGGTSLTMISLNEMEEDNFPNAKELELNILRETTCGNWSTKTRYFTKC